MANKPTMRPTRKSMGGVVVETPTDFDGEYITLKVADGRTPTKSHHLGKKPFGFRIVDSVTEGDGIYWDNTRNANKVKFFRSAGTLADIKIWIF